MPSAWDTIDIAGSWRQGRANGARSYADKLLRKGDHEGAAAALMPHNSAEAARLRDQGEQILARQERRAADTFDRDVAPLVAQGDFAGAQQMALQRRRPTAEVMQMMEFGRQMDAQTRERIRNDAFRTALEIRGWRNLQPAEQAQRYATLRTRLAAESPVAAEQLPEAYDPAIAETLMLRSMDTAKAFEILKADERAEIDRQRLELEGRRVSALEARVTQQGRGGDDGEYTLVENPPGLAPGLYQRSPRGQLTPMAGQTQQLTDGQRVAGASIRRMEEAERVLATLGANVRPSQGANALEAVPIYGQSMAAGQRNQSQRTLDNMTEAWSEAYLRATSGAAVTEGEVRRAQRTYFPYPGDSAADIKRKDELRKIANASIRDMLPPNYRAAGGGAPTAPPPPPPPDGAVRTERGPDGKIRVVR